MYFLDIETLDVESTAVILSVAVLYVDLAKPKHTWESLYENTLFVKLSVKDQVKNYGRTIEKSTIDWWNKQCDLVKTKSFFPTKTDLTVEEAIEVINRYIADQCENNQNTLVWIRGSLDQVCLDSLYKKAGKEPAFRFSNYRDVRTFIEFQASNPVRGYCNINKELYPDFNRELVIKHNPIDDVVIDALMVLYPE